MSHSKQNQYGLTLIEVLIALAILSIAFTAILKVTTEHIQTTSYLKHKTIAALIALQVINEVRADLLELPFLPDRLNAKTTLLGETVEWSAFLANTSNPHIREIHVSTKYINMTGYDYVSS